MLLFGQDCEASVIDIKGEYYIVSEKKFTKEVDSYIQPLKDWLSKETTLEAYNTRLFEELWNKHAEGSIPHWSMEALCYYDGEHELEQVNEKLYGIVNFFELPEEPDKFFKWEMNRFSSKKVNCLSCYEELDLDFKEKTVLITGNFEKYEKRDMLASEIHKRGATVVKTFTKNLSMLIVGSDAGPKKLETAKQLGVKIIDENKLYKMLEDNNAID